MKRLLLLLVLLLPLALAASSPGRAAPPPSWFDNAGRADAFSGGVRMIDVDTPKGKFRVWTKRVPAYANFPLSRE